MSEIEEIDEYIVYNSYYLNENPSIAFKVKAKTLASHNYDLHGNSHNWCETGEIILLELKTEPKYAILHTNTTNECSAYNNKYTPNKESEFSRYESESQALDAYKSLIKEKSVKLIE